MNSNYWVDFWKNYTSDISNKDEQSQVLRTYNKKPISNDLWEFTINQIDEVFKVEPDEIILDLCSGNGLLSKHFVGRGGSVVSVDISEELLSEISHIDGIETIQSDIRNVNFKEESFDKIILYAGIQYLTYKEAAILLKNIYKWLKPKGIVFIGDIPNWDKRWGFFNSIERHKVYFDNLITDKAIVGTWFEREWFEYLTAYIGFNKGEFIKQDKKLIYSSFRFDFLYKK